MVCIIQTFTLTSRSLHLPVRGKLISSISFEILGFQYFFPEIWNLVSPFSGLSDSTLLISSSSAFSFSSEGCCSLSISFTIAVGRSSSSACAIFSLLSQVLFLDCQDGNLSFDHSLPSSWPVDHVFCLLFASFLSVGSFGSILLSCLGRMYQFVAMPLGIATGPSGFTSLVKEVRKLALRLGISVHMLQHN